MKKRTLFYRRKRTVGLYAVATFASHFSAFDIVPPVIFVVCRLKKGRISSKRSTLIPVSAKKEVEFFRILA